MSSATDGVLARIADRLDDLRRSEQKVARTVLDDPGVAMRSTVSGLAALAGVSEPTIIRFTNAVGCDGFADLKLQLAQELALGVPATQSALQADDDVASITSKIFDFSVTSLAHTRRNLDGRRIEQAVDALACARDITFIGLGASGIVAQDAQQKFPLFGVPCAAPVDHHQQYLSAAVADPRSVVVAFSNVGRTGTVLHAVRTARSRGATTIGVSGGPTPLLDICDIPIVVEALDNTDVYTPTISRLAQLVVVDVLATAVFLRRDEQALTDIRAAKAGLAHLRRTPVPELVHAPHDADDPDDLGWADA
ncbi:SIS domain-containing protein [Euzebya sp.]|uniref:SIS domain-containing protein n=1 Tax=Euzebya sp. TaxID=1971409 RepID=UPI0035123C42